MTVAGPGAERLTVLRVCHSAVVTRWRRRDRELRRLGVDLELVAPRKWNEGGHDVVLEPGGDDFVHPTGTLGRHPYLFVYDPRPLWRVLRSRSFDIIDTHEEPASLAAAEIWLLARLAGQRSALCYYCAQNIPKRYPVPFRWIERATLRRAAGVHTCNEEAGHILRAKGFSGVIRNLGLGVDVARFAPGPDSGPGAGHHDPTGPLRVGYVGRLEAHKGVDVLVRAVAGTPGVTLEVVGAGPERGRLEELVTALDVADRVGVAGFVDPADLGAVYRRFDLVAVPSLETPSWIEQFGRVAVEAMASGVVVVASDSGSLPQVVADAGVLVPPGDVDAWADALARLRDDDTERSRLADAGSVRASAFAWPQVARRHLDFYETTRDQVAEVVPADRPTNQGRPLDVDVVVVTYNSADRLDQAIGPLQTATTDGLGIIVVDNASGDGSADRARALGATVIANPVNAGFAAAANQGVAAGSAEFVLLLNPDASLSVETLARMVAALDNDPGLAVVAPNLRQSDGLQRVWWPFPTAAGAWYDAFGLQRLGLGPLGRADEVAGDPGFVVGACFLVRRAAFEAVGGLDPRFWLYGEETDLCRRLIDAGWSVGVVDAMAEHVGGASASGVEGLVFEHFQRGTEHFVAKHEGIRQLWSLRVAQAVGSAVRIAAPGSSERRALHRRRLVRQVRTLVRSPGQVPLDSPATAAPGRGAVVCASQPWDEAGGPDQALVRDLLTADPLRRVLFVEPPRTPGSESPSGGRQPRRPGLRPVDPDGRVVRFEPSLRLFGRLGGLTTVSLNRQVGRAAARLGFEHPELWVGDDRYAGLAGAVGWPVGHHNGEQHREAWSGRPSDVGWSRSPG